MKSTISRQCPFGTDEAVQISRTSCCDKGAQPQYFNKKAKSPYKLGHQILIFPGCFGFKLSKNFNKPHTTGKMCLEA